MRILFLRWPLSHELETAYRDQAPSLLAYARSFGFDTTTAEDILHHVFLQVMQNGRMPREARPYLFRAVRNACLNRVRAVGREADLEGREWFATEGNDRSSEIDLRHALKALPEDQREVLMMHVWGGLTFEEIGDIAGISANTASSRYRYGLSSLRRLLCSEKHQVQE